MINAATALHGARAQTAGGGRRMSISLKLLGEYTAYAGNGTSLSLPTRKTWALLGYLAANADRPQSRERLMALLWSDRDERQARQSLNHALLSIRKLGKSEGSPLLDSTGEQVTLHSDALEIDVLRFRDLLSEQPAAAAALYDGPFLGDLSIPDPAFEEWLAVARSDFHTLAGDALERAIEAAASADSIDAIEAARRLVRLDPVRESGHQHLMRLLYEHGDRASALRQYHDCAAILEKRVVGGTGRGNHGALRRHPARRFRRRHDRGAGGRIGDPARTGTSGAAAPAKVALTDLRRDRCSDLRRPTHRRQRGGSV